MRCLTLIIALIFSAGLLKEVTTQTQAQALNQRQPGSVTFEPYKLKSGSQEIDAELGRLVVKENRRNPKSKLIELAFVRLKSTEAKPGYPVVYLDGGPGSSAINIAQFPEYTRAFLKLREVGDVILLDQRGIGRSRPNLSRLSPTLLPLDAFANREVALKAFMERAQQAADYFRGQGVDLAAYNTAESAHDLDDLRQALGAEKLNLVGFSYGTHLGLAALRYHSDRLNRVALIGTEGPDHTRKLPSTSDASLRRLSSLAAQDPQISAKMPDLFGTLRQALERLEKEPVTITLARRGSNEPLEVKVGRFGLQVILMQDLGDTNDLPIFPALIYTMGQGDYSILKRFVERRFFQYSGGVSLMTLVMDASSGATKARDAQIAREARTALLGNAMNFPFPEIGAAFGNPDLGDEFRAPLRTTVPTLFISGTLDNNTPPFQAEEVRRTFKQSLHLVIENAGHESMLVNAEVQQAIGDYLNGRDVSQVKVALPPLKFVPLPEKKTSTQ
jgi:pimeloyl-ACP methyl ester carboxylesterase